MNLQPFGDMDNETRPSELPHEKADLPPCCSCHAGERLMTDHGDFSFGPALLPEISQQEQSASYSYFAGVEELLHQILLVANAPCHQ